MFVQYLSGLNSATPIGPAGGDLAGTYPNPTVIALEETSTPARLALAAIPDQTFLQRSGLTVVGTDPNTVVKGPWSSVLYVDNVRGNDTTGTRGNANLPFATIQAAVNAASSKDVIMLAPQNHVQTSSITRPATLTSIVFQGVAVNPPGLSAAFTLGTVVSGILATPLFDFSANLGLTSVAFNDMFVRNTGAGSGINLDGSGYAAGTYLTTGASFYNMYMAGGAAGLVVLKYCAGLASFWACRLFGIVLITSCNGVYCVDTNSDLAGLIAGANVTITYNGDDALAPTTNLPGGLLLIGSALGTITMTAQAQLYGDPQSTVLGIVAGAGGLFSNTVGNRVPSFAYRGAIGGGNGGIIDLATNPFQDTATAFSLDFRGCFGITDNGLVNTVKAKVAGAAANFKTLDFGATRWGTGVTFTAGAGVHMNLRGAVTPSAVYTTPDATGDLTPGMGFTGTTSLAAGGTVAKVWDAGLGYTGLVRTTTAPDTAFVTSNAAAADAVISVKATTGLTFISAVVGGNTAANWQAIWK